MITVTSRAAEQIKKSAEEGGMQALALRLAVRENDDGSFEYGMGFDETKDDDMAFQSEGVELIIAPQYGPMLKGTVIDFVEYQPGDHRFIFMNPNDPNYEPPKEEEEHGGPTGFTL